MNRPQIILLLVLAVALAIAVIWLLSGTGEPALSPPVPASNH